MPAPLQTIPYYDIAILGAGFSGILSVYEARKRGLSAHIWDAQADFGGTWHQNRYPGARVDSELPHYEIPIPEVYETWNWLCRFPDWREIRKYFAHVVKVLDLKKDTTLNTYITDASFDESKGLWTISTKDGPVAQSRIFLPLVGFALTLYKPDFPGFDKFKGTVHHLTQWPEAVDDDYGELKGKKIGVIGTGATGVQIIQESGPRAKELYVFQRTPNLALRMGQKFNYKPPYEKTPEFFVSRRLCPGGFSEPEYHEKWVDHTPEEREAYWESLWQRGGFGMWVNNYADYLTNEDANLDVYRFWRKKVHQRVKDPKVAEKLAPEKPPHPFCTKRPSLEQNYYEQYNRPNVHLIDVNETPIKEFYEDGVILSDGTKCEIDTLVLATGFDAVTGSFKNFNIWSKDHTQTVFQHWNKPEGCTNFLGIACKGFPNMFFTFGPLSPAAFSNGPSCIEVQVEYMFKLIDKLVQGNYKYFEPKEEYENAYRKRIDDIAEGSMFMRAKSWWNGSNIPGKKMQMVNFLEGLPAYAQLLAENTKKSFEGVQFYT